MPRLDIPQNVIALFLFSLATVKFSSVLPLWVWSETQKLTKENSLLLIMKTSQAIQNSFQHLLCYFIITSMLLCINIYYFCVHMFSLILWRRNFLKSFMVFLIMMLWMYTVVNDKKVYRYNSPTNEDYANCGLHVKLWNLWLMPFCCVIKVNYFLSSIFASVPL